MIKTIEDLLDASRVSQRTRSGTLLPVVRNGKTRILRSGEFRIPVKTTRGHAEISNFDWIDGTLVPAFWQVA